MNVLEAIAKRRSVRKYLDKPVEDDKLRRIAEAALWAPSGQNKQPLRLWIVRDGALLAEAENAIYKFGLKLKKLRPFIKMFVPEFRGQKGKAVFRSLKPDVWRNGKALILTGADPSVSTTYKIDCILAAQNIQLAALELGLGSCYIGWAKLINRLPQIKKRLQIPKEIEIIDVVVVGYTDFEGKAPERKAVDDVTIWL